MIGVRESFEPPPTEFDALRAAAVDELWNSGVRTAAVAAALLPGWPARGRLPRFAVAAAPAAAQVRGPAALVMAWRAAGGPPLSP